MRLSPLSGKSLGRCIMGFTTISPRSLVYDFSTWGAPFHHLFPCQKWAIATFPILGNSKICGTTTSSGKLPLKKHLLSLDTLNTLSTSSRADPYIVHISPPKLTVIFIHLLDELTVNLFKAPWAAHAWRRKLLSINWFKYTPKSQGKGMFLGVISPRRRSRSDEERGPGKPTVAMETMAGFDVLPCRHGFFS